MPCELFLFGSNPPLKQLAMVDITALKIVAIGEARCADLQLLAKLNQGPVSEHLLNFPQTVEELPSDIRLIAFPNNKRAAPVPPAVMQLTQFTRTHPARSSLRFVMAHVAFEGQQSPRWAA